MITAKEVRDLKPNATEILNEIERHILLYQCQGLKSLPVDNIPNHFYEAIKKVLLDAGFKLKERDPESICIQNQLVISW